MFLLFLCIEIVKHGVKLNSCDRNFANYLVFLMFSYIKTTKTEVIPKSCDRNFVNYLVFLMFLYIKTTKTEVIPKSCDRNFSNYLVFWCFHLKKCKTRGNFEHLLSQLFKLPGVFACFINENIKNSMFLTFTFQKHW